MRPAPSVQVCPEYTYNVTCGFLSPEKTLLVAVLWRAFWDLSPKVELQYRNTAISWFEGRHVCLEGFDYSTVVDVLDLSPHYQKVIKEEVARAKSIKANCDNKSETKRGACGERSGRMAPRTRGCFSAKN